MISSKYLDILRRKIMEKVVVEEIKEGKRKEKEKNQVKRTTKLGFVINQTTQKCVEKHARTKFITITVVEVGDCFHQEL